MGVLRRPHTEPGRGMTIPWWHPVLGDEEAHAVADVLASGFPNDGEVTERFAARIASIAGAAHGIGVSSGSAAIYCGLVACGIAPGDEVVVPGPDVRGDRERRAAGRRAAGAR